MGTFVLDKDQPYGKQITAALGRRGLVPTKGSPESAEEWIVHGPHGPEMNYPVFIGYATTKAAGEVGRKREMLVVVYPWAVYELEDGDDSKWWDTGRNRRIPTIMTKNRHLRPRF